MKRTIGNKWSWVLAVCLLGISGDALGQFSVGVSGGPNFCLPNGAADCEDIYPLGYVNAGIEYRFLTFIGVGADYNLSGLTPREGTISIGAQHAVAMLRGHLPIPLVGIRAIGGLGMGYGELWGEHEKNPGEPFYTFVSPFLTVRADAAVLWELPLGLSAGAEAVWVGYVSGERCFNHPLGQSDCAATSDLSGGEADVIDLLQVGGTVRYEF